MGIKDMIDKARRTAAGTVARHRDTIDKGIDTVAEAANKNTSGRYESQIRKGATQTRAGLDKIDPDQPGPDSPDPVGPKPR